MRTARYVAAFLLGALAVGLVVLPFTLRDESGQAAPTQWLFEAALGIPVLLVAVLVWPKKDGRNRRAA